jgi:diguanylate cyclase (GGDEF)-like protein
MADLVTVRWRRLSPFAVAALLPFPLVALPPGHWDAGLVLASAALTVLVGAAVVLLPWSRLPSFAAVLPGAAYLLAVALLREAGGGMQAGVAPLMVLPVIWLSLYGTRGQLSAIIASSALFLVLPILITGAPEYPPGGLRLGILFMATAGITGFTVHGLVARAKAQAVERLRLLADVNELAHTDALTGLPNRRAWHAELHRAIARATRTGEPLAIASLDVDNFKTYNDTYGHDEGDRLLERLTDAIRDELRPDDVLARLGGDEFALLLPGCDEDQARNVLERVLHHPSPTHGCSIGVAEWDGAEPGAETLRRADRALYDAKRKGGNRLATGRDRTRTEARGLTLTRT